MTRNLFEAHGPPAAMPRGKPVPQPPKVFVIPPWIVLDGTAPPVAHSVPFGSLPDDHGRLLAICGHRGPASDLADHEVWPACPKCCLRAGVK